MTNNVTEFLDIVMAIGGVAVVVVLVVIVLGVF